MSRIEVLGRDAGAEAYRVRAHLDAGTCEAQVPECLMETLRPGERPSHQEAYEWIAAHRARIASAVAARRGGQVPRTPWDLVTLLREDGRDGG
ncbi:hypothetical protein OCH239_08435 [Roseivivax halodurans JCM 10272]|uniref:Uncharacterized protein n=1 Tax=Roseivivax halodurans JCM 10272 TaxID=1449350 RepID=X7EM60_9RHOB|nr:hypothetical protein [Roseivivax halodurans]ETX16261.1 hypothetical protein OCH239_08435 [Roseivivax halodurans JCM 10272]